MLTALIVITLGGVAFILLLFILINWDYGRRQDRAQVLEERFGAEQVQRAGEKFRLVRQIGAPECPDGTYSPNQMALWAKYRQLDEWDQYMTVWEMNLIVETKGYS